MQEIKRDIVVGTNVVGQPIYITKYEIDSEKSGKVVYIQGGIHGGEITLNIIRTIYNYIKKNIVSGKVIFVPFANPIGWSQTAYTYTIGKFSNKTGEDFNRTYGKTVINSANAKISSEILKLCENVNLAIDLHTAHTSFPHTISFRQCDLEIVKQANIEYNKLCFNTEEYKTTLSANLVNKDIASFAIECGSHDDINYKYEEEVSSGILNIIKNMQIIKNSPKQKKVEQLGFEKCVSYYAEMGGIVNFKKCLGEKFKKGDVLFTIMPPNLQESEKEVVAEFDGIVFRFTKTHIFNTYDEVMRVFKLENLNTI